MKTWQLQEAKMKFSDLVKSAKNSPQLITVRGLPEAVIISVKAYSKLNKKDLSLLEIMQKFPNAGLKIPPRSKDSKTRKISL